MITSSVQLCTAPGATLYDSFDDGGLFHFNGGSHVPVVGTATRTPSVGNNEHNTYAPD